MLTLYDDSWSPNCVKVRLVLREIEAVMPLRWRTIPVDLDRGEQHEKRFLKLNPVGRVPVLVDGGLVLRESGAILIYLAERFDRAHLLPPSTRGRAEALQWLFFQATELGRATSDLYEEVCFTEEARRHNDLVKVYRDDLRHLLDVLNEHLRRGRPKYLLGSQACIADFAMVSSLDLLPDVGIDLAEWKLVQSYVERLHERPSWKGVWPDQ
jgi:glutathione S-transferase